jgi:hypothetical protein
MTECNTPNFKIPKGYSKYRVSPDGKVFSFHREKFLKGSINPAGYTNIRLTSDNGVTLTWGLHRLIAFCFICSDYEKFGELYVNHKDGNKHNNTLENLEIVTPKQNVEHAGLNNLSRKCLPILVRDVKSGLISEYPSIIECSKHLGVSKDTVLYRLRYLGKRLSPSGQQFKLKKDKTPWVEIKDLEEAKKLYGRNKSVAVRTYPAIERITIYSSCNEVSSKLGLSTGYVSQLFYNKDQPVIDNFIQLKPNDNSIPWVTHTDFIESYENFTGCKVITVWNCLTDERKIYKSVTSCASDNGIKITTLHWRLNQEAKVHRDGRKYVYYSQLSPLEKKLFKESL